MALKMNLRHTQSLRSITTSCDLPTCTEAGLLNRQASVSELVARYQTTVEVSTSTQATLKYDSEVQLKQATSLSSLPYMSSVLDSKESQLQSLMKRNQERGKARATTELKRSKSVGSLQSSSGTIDALRELFESKDATQHKVTNSFKPAKPADMIPGWMNGEDEVNSPVETLHMENTYPGANKDDVTQKVVNLIQKEARKTTGGIDFEKIAASQADDKKRPAADFRESSYVQEKENLHVSVKAISALYLSKVTRQEKERSLFKPKQDQSPGPGIKVKQTKMAEDSEQKEKNLLLPPSASHHQGSDDDSGAYAKQSAPTQLSKEKLYQQRQKSELRRLLKHTHPELKMLDDVVDEELAEVLSSESGVTPVDSRYEGEVLLRRLLFENCSLSNVSSYAPKMHLAGGEVGRSDISASAVFDEPHKEDIKGMLDLNPDRKTEGVDEVIGTDVQSTRRIFERHSVTTLRPCPDTMLKEKVFIPADETGPVQNQNQEVGMSAKGNLGAHTNGQSADHEYSENQACVKVTSTGQTVLEDASANLPDPESTGEFIQTSTALFQNNPFISANIARENSDAHGLKCQDSMAIKGCLTDNVKNRAHLFESMPFDKIRQQNEEEIQTMVEDIKETLNFLYPFNVIHSAGSIIEVTETMKARKAKFILSENGLKVKYNEVVEGGAQNFIHHELPRANLKPQVTYLKEDSRGSIKATVVKVPVHHHQTTANHGAEFKTANVVQLIENILNQDNSLRKGVIIQEDINRWVEVIVYALYNYVDEADVKSYSPTQDHAAECNVPEMASGEESKYDTTGISNGDVKSNVRCLLETLQEQSCPGSVSPEVTLKGNVKLFKTCIERGDLEYMKSLWAESAMQEQELSPTQNTKVHPAELYREHRVDQAQENPEFHSECPPVDIKRLKNIFSANQSQPKQNTYEDRVQSPGNPRAFTDDDAPLQKHESSHEQEKNNFRRCRNKAHEEALNLAVSPQMFSHVETLEDNRIHRAELVEAVDDGDETCNLQSAIQSYCQDTTRSYQHSTQEKLKLSSLESSREPFASIVVGDTNSLRNLDKETHHLQKSAQKDEMCNEPVQDEHPLAPNITSENKSVSQHDCTEISCPDTDRQKVVTGSCGEKAQSGTEIVQKPDSEAAVLSSSATLASQQKDEEAVQGKRQAALDALERSNINVSRGDFKAAMIYRNSSQSLKQTSQKMDGEMTQKATSEEFYPVAKQKSAVPVKQDIRTQEATAANAEHPNQRQTQNKPTISKRSRRPLGPKPAIPPKPEHLKVKHKDQSNMENPNPTQTSTMKHQIKKEDKLPQSFPVTSTDYPGEQKQDLSKTNRGVESEPDHGRNKLFGDEIPLSPQVQINHQVQGSFGTIGRQIKDVDTAEARCFSGKDNENETDDAQTDCHEACQTFQGEKVCSVRKAPVKPKRVKMNTQTPKHAPADYNSPIVTHPEQTLTVSLRNHSNICGENADSSSKERKVALRENKGWNETEDERRQRLSVHMDEIMKGNRTAAMEIFDKLQKQEELQSILTRVEESEQGISQVDERSLRTVFENIPAWVVSSEKKETQVKLENRDDILPSWKDNDESKASVTHVFGDLERAREEIVNLKKQTLARLMDIEEAIKKALYSVSTLKSDSDIAGLSCLFKETLGTEQGPSPLGNISKINIGSSRAKSAQVRECPRIQETVPTSQGASPEIISRKPWVSHPSSPAFISIQSAARKADQTNQTGQSDAMTLQARQHSPKMEEKFPTTKILKCTGAAQNNQVTPEKEVRNNPLTAHLTANESSLCSKCRLTLTGTATETATSKISTVVTTQPDTLTSTSVSGHDTPEGSAERQPEYIIQL